MSQSAILEQFSPTGKLRAAINLGNPILAHRDERNGAVSGVSVDLARALTQRLGLEIELVIFDAAGKSVQAVSNEVADIGFFAIDPVRGAGLVFTAAYVLIEGSYLVSEASPIQRNDQVDRANQVVVVGLGSAYDLFLTRELQQATIFRAPSSPTVVDVFLRKQANVAAGVRQQLESDARRLGGLRVLDGRFMVIEQAMGMPKGRKAWACPYLADFVEEMKASGFIADAMKRHGILGAVVAPPFASTFFD